MVLFIIRMPIAPTGAANEKPSMNPFNMWSKALTSGKKSGKPGSVYDDHSSRP